MLVFVLHEFAQTAEGSAAVQQIVKTCSNDDSVWFTPTYPTNNPHLAHIFLTDLVRKEIADHNDYNILFIGVQLGGFWARHLARIFPPAKIALLNPTIYPWRELQNFVGMNTNKGNGTRFELVIGDVRTFEIYRVDQDRSDQQGVVIQNNTLGFDDKTRLKMYMMEGTTITDDEINIVYEEFFEKEEI